MTMKSIYPIICQSTAWQKCNIALGHHAFFVDLPGTHTLVIIKDARRGRYMEIPGGPNIDWQDKDVANSTTSILKKLAHDEHCVFIRIRPQAIDTPEARQSLINAGFREAQMHLAAEHTVILDLEKPEEELLSDMRRQTRYDVRRSAKLGITVDSDNSEELFREFHSVQAETARRQDFVPPSLRDLLAEREAFGEYSRIYVARSAEGAPIAYGLILINNDNGTLTDAAYYEAASTDLNRTLPGAYALQWQVIKDLKQLGVKYYNLWGIAPPGVTNHRYSGVTTFKTGFGGEVISFVPAHDLVVDKVKYLKNYFVETIRKKKRHL